jgi:hypothetical protein
MAPGSLVVEMGHWGLDGEDVPRDEVMIVTGPPCRPRGKYDPWQLPVLSPTRGEILVPIERLQGLPPGTYQE